RVFVVKTWCSGVALFLPRVADGVVAAHLPETEAVLGEKGDRLHEFRIFPRVKFRDDDAGRTAVFAGDGRAIELRGDEHIVVEAVLERDVGRVTVVAGEIDELRLRFDLREFEERGECDAAPP